MKKNAVIGAFWGKKMGNNNFLRGGRGNIGVRAFYLGKKQGIKIFFLGRKPQIR